nr:purine/pyrimidine permease [Sporosarcina sp. Te-1]
MLIGEEKTVQSDAVFTFEWFLLGKPSWNIGFIVMAVITGLLNLANTFGALKGTEEFYNSKTTQGQYDRSLGVSGIFTGISGLFGLVPYAPFVSSIGFLEQTGIVRRLPFIMGGALFCLIGAITPLANLFSNIPISIGSTVLFVAYLQLLHSSLEFLRQIEFTKTTIYRSAIPLFVGVAIMILPTSYFSSLPEVLQPLLGSGLLVGICLSILLENTINWGGVGKKNESK